MFLIPKFDRTGPSGVGPMSGQGRGYCIVPLTDDNLDTLNSNINQSRPFRRNSRRRPFAMGRRLISERYNKW